MPFGFASTRTAVRARATASTPRREAFGFDADGLGDAGPAAGQLPRARLLEIARRCPALAISDPRRVRQRDRPRRALGARMQFGVFCEIPVPRPWTPGQRARGLPTHARAGRARRRARLPQLLDGGAPLPRGVLALLRAGRALRRRRRAHAPDPHRPRRAPAAVSVQPPDPRRRGRRRDRPDLGRPPRVRHRALVDAHRARGLRHRPGADAPAVGRGARDDRRRLDAGRLRVARPALRLPAASRDSEAAPAAPPAAVGGLDQPGEPRDRRAAAASACSPSRSASRPKTWPSGCGSTARAWRWRSRSGSS